MERFAQFDAMDAKTCEDLKLKLEPKPAGWVTKPLGERKLRPAELA